MLHATSNRNLLSFCVLMLIGIGQTARGQMHLVKDITTAPQSSVYGNPPSPVEMNGIMYFSAYTNLHQNYGVRMVRPRVREWLKISIAAATEAAHLN
jgi:hypothetical protein